MEGSFGNVPGQLNADILRRKLRLDGKRVLRVSMEMCGRPRKAVMAELGITDAQLSRILSEKMDDGMPADLIPLWTAAVGPQYAEWLRLQLPDTYHPHTEENPLRLVGLLAKSIGDNTQAITDDIAADGAWDDGERHLPGFYRARNYVDDLIRMAEEAGRLKVAQ